MGTKGHRGKAGNTKRGRTRTMLETAPAAVPVRAVVTHTFALEASGLVIGVFTPSSSVISTTPSQGHTEICFYRAVPNNE